MISNADSQLNIIETDKHKVLISNEELGAELTNTPAKILKVLLENPNKLVTYETIMESVWGNKGKDLCSAVRTMDVHLINVRYFLEDCECGYQILRVRSVGMILQT